MLNNNDEDPDEKEGEDPHLEDDHYLVVPVIRTRTLVLHTVVTVRTKFLVLILALANRVEIIQWM